MVNIIKPNLAFNGSLTPINKSRVDKFVQHHMAHQTWNINDVHNFHKNSNGWAGIGYNYWIGFDGKIYQGRGMNVGAHVGGHNSHTIGVGYQGDFTKQNMTDAQLQSGIALNKWLMSQFPNVNATSQIIGHNDLASTACPGKHFRMTELRKGVGGGSHTPPKTQTKPSNSNKISWKKLTGNWTGQTLRNGEYGDPVTQLQKKLGIKADSYFGDDTEKAVKQVQRNAGIAVDGLAGKATYNAFLGANLTVDGKWGKAVTRALQKALGTPVDGVISKQPKNSVSQSLYGNTVQFGSGGSNVIVALQKKLGVNADGKLGPATIKVLQRYLGTTQDGVLSKPSLVVKELQRRLNNGTF